MTTNPAGFAERVFEFAFNAEFCAAHSSLLAAAPMIPSQQDEKWLGYDVEFLINSSGGIVESFCLQHKVSRFVGGCASTNRHFWKEAGGPYFAFRLDVDQFNLLEALASAGLPGIHIHYCAPLFVSRKKMNGHFIAQTVSDNSLWIAIAGVGPLSDNEPHSIVYSADGSSATVFSAEARRLQVIRAESFVAKDSQGMHVTKMDLERTYDTAFKIATKYWTVDRLKGRTRVRRDESSFVLARPPKREVIDDFRSAVRAVRFLFADHFGVSWLVRTKNVPN